LQVSQLSSFAGVSYRWNQPMGAGYNWGAMQTYYVVTSHIWYTYVKVNTRYENISQPL